MLESEEIDLQELRKKETFKTKRYHDAVYMGETGNRRRHGQGIMRYKNGRIYEGTWKDDHRHGSGFEKYPNENTYLGIFKNGN